MFITVSNMQHSRDSRRGVAQQGQQERCSTARMDVVEHAQQGRTVSSMHSRDGRKECSTAGTAGRSVAQQGRRWCTRTAGKTVVYTHSREDGRQVEHSRKMAGMLSTAGRVALCAEWLPAVLRERRALCAECIPAVLRERE